MPRSQQAPTTNAAIFNIKLSPPLMELETSSVMVPASIGISPLLILSTMVNACSIASVMITMKAIRAESIKIEPRRYFFKTRCPRPGNIRPDRSAAFIDLLISSALTYGRLPERPLSAKSGYSLTVNNISYVLGWPFLARLSRFFSCFSCFWRSRSILASRSSGSQLSASGRIPCSNPK